jgi:hypothetical protein
MRELARRAHDMDTRRNTVEHELLDVGEFVHA